MSKGRVVEFTVAGGDGSGDDSPGDDDPGDAGGAGAPGNQRPWRGPLPWVGCAVVILLLGVALAGPLHGDVGPWGRVADVTGEPQQAWKLDTAEEVYTARMTDGVLVTTGPYTVRGLDPGSGEVLWEVAQTGARCTTDSANLICTDLDHRTLQIDPRSGATTDVDVPNAIAVTEASGDLFAIIGREDAQVQRISDGTVLWSTPVSLGQPYYSSQSAIAVIAGHVLTTMVVDESNFGAVGAVFDAETGERWQGEQPQVLQLGPGVWTSVDVDHATLFVRGADEPLEADGYRPLQYDEQWQSQDVVTMDPQTATLQVRDRASGQVRWTSEPGTYPIARTEGVLFTLVQNGRTTNLQGLQVGSGELLWERVDSWMMCPCVGDGSTLAAQLNQITNGDSFDSDGPVVGIDAVSGALLWALDAPPSMTEMLTDGRHLVLISAWQLSGWQLG